MQIAVAIDGSDNALRAAKYAVSFAKHMPLSTLDVIFVADYNKATKDRLLAQSPESVALTRKQKIDPVLELAKEAHLETKTTVLKGNPSEEIIRYVNEGKIDHLVLGSRGLNVFQEMILGSVSHKVMKHVSCPVTIIK